MSDRQILNLPQHVSTSPKRTASAPYNFVPLPETIVTAVDDAEQLPNHDTYANAGYSHTGYFEVTLTTKSPLYVRCPFTMPEFLCQEREEDQDKPFRNQVKNTPYFFYTRDPNRPVIPGSSLRGMLRSVLEIVSYGKIERVTDSLKVFYRAVAAAKDDPLAEPYRQTLGKFGSNVRAGYLIKRGNDWYVKPAKKPEAMGWPEKGAYLKVKEARIPTDAISGLLRFNSPSYMPQYHPVSFDIEIRKGKRGRFVAIARIGPPDAGYAHRGVLVCSGNMLETGGEEATSPRRNYALVLETGDAKPLKINSQAVTDYLDALTPFQTELPFDKYMGCLQDGFPIFYVEGDGEVLFFGHSPNFRVPAFIKNQKRAATPLDFVPPELRRPEDIDYADALFGLTKGDKIEAPQGSKGRAYASRVFVTDATLIEGQTDLWFPNDPIIVPKILAAPKSTAFQHYLVQASDDKATLKHYGSSTPRDTVLRGYKRYWHQGAGTDNGLSLDKIREMIEEEKDKLREITQQEAKGKPNTQHTQFKPVRPGIQFKFRVYFENLSARELGALCWMLYPLGEASKNYCHHLGMGKPLGMGAVKLDATLHLTNRVTRYGSLFEGDNWKTGASSSGSQLSDRSTLEWLTKEFEQHILGMLKPNKPCAHLFEIRRIGMLLKMLEWPGFPPVPATSDNRFLANQNRPNTRYMSGQLPGAPSSQRNEYRDRPVLPDPSGFGDLTGDAVPMMVAVTSNEMGATDVSASSSSSAQPSPKASGSSTLLTARSKHSSQRGVKKKPESKQAVVTTERELVTLIEDAKRGTAQVQTKDGEYIVCTGFPHYPVAERGMRCRADVTRQDEKVQRATFKRWE